MTIHSGRGSFGRAAGVLVLASTLAGCASEGVRGVVISGRAGGVFTVAADDPRLSRGGIAGASVSIRSTEGDTSAPLGEARTGGDGSFSVGVARREALKNELRITAEAPGHLDTRGRAFSPGSGRVLLVVMRPDGTTSAE